MAEMERKVYVLMFNNARIYQGEKMKRKLCDRYTGDRGTLHRRIANGTISARPGYVFMVFTTGILKPYALEIATSEVKYRGTHIDRLPESDYLSPDR
jgi:hypothetical protein